jgi:hypothetical protein
MKKKTLYVIPLCEEVHSHMPAVLCGSPDYGESEDIGYEDWTLT